MARHLRTNTEIDNFITKVIQDANHHAPNVAAVVTPLSNAVRARINLAIDKIAVYERNGNIARTCWVTIGGNRYVCTYNHDTQKIDLKRRTLQGALIFQFDNNTSAQSIAVQVAAL